MLFEAVSFALYDLWDVFEDCLGSFVNIVFEVVCLLELFFADCDGFTKEVGKRREEQEGGDLYDTDEAVVFGDVRQEKEDDGKTEDENYLRNEAKSYIEAEKVKEEEEDWAKASGCLHKEEGAGIKEKYSQEPVSIAEMTLSHGWDQLESGQDSQSRYGVDSQVAFLPEEDREEWGDDYQGLQAEFLHTSSIEDFEERIKGVLISNFQFPIPNSQSNLNESMLRLSGNIKVENFNISRSNRIKEGLFK